jgi:hypothetical protein
MFRISIILIVLLVQGGCYNQKPQEVREYYSSGSIKELILLNGNSEKHGINVEFYENGDTARISRFMHNKLDSIEVINYPSGRRKIRRSWRDGTLLGEYRDYYEDAETVYYSLMDGDTVAVVEPAVNKYKFYYNNGSLLYYREYDPKGQVIKKKGSGIISLNPIDRSDDYYILGDTLNVQVLLASPNYVKRKFQVLSLKDDSLIAKKQIEINEGLSSAFYSHILAEKGSYTFIGISTFTSIVDTSEEIDSVYFSLKLE